MVVLPYNNEIVLEYLNQTICSGIWNRLSQTRQQT